MDIYLDLSIYSRERHGTLGMHVWAEQIELHKLCLSYKTPTTYSFGRISRDCAPYQEYLPFLRCGQHT